MRRLVPATLLFALASAPAPAAERLDIAGEIHAYCDGLDRQAAADKLPVRIFADVANGSRGAAATWQEFRSDEVRNLQDTGKNLNQSAHVWSKARHPVYVHILYQSPSRDWAQFTHYCFRPDGSLARVTSELRTYQGRARVVRSIAYGSSRAVLSRSEQILDLASGEPRLGRDFEDHRAPVFWSLSELPFYGLLAPRGSNGTSSTPPSGNRR